MDFIVMMFIFLSIYLIQRYNNRVNLEIIEELNIIKEKYVKLMEEHFYGKK